jgi:hypothetical protein
LHHAARESREVVEVDVAVDIRGAGAARRVVDGVDGCRR